MERCRPSAKAALEDFHEAHIGALKGKNTPIKTALSGQRIGRGWGISMSCETLYRNVHPPRRAGGAHISGPVCGLVRSCRRRPEPQQITQWIDLLRDFNTR